MASNTNLLQARRCIQACKQQRRLVLKRDEVRVGDHNPDGSIGCMIWEYHGNPIAIYDGKKWMVSYCGWNTISTYNRIHTLECQEGGRLPRYWGGAIELKNYPKCPVCGRVYLDRESIEKCQEVHANKGKRDRFSCIHGDQFDGRWNFPDGCYMNVKYYPITKSFYIILYDPTGTDYQQNCVDVYTLRKVLRWNKGVKA